VAERDKEMSARILAFSQRIYDGSYTFQELRERLHDFSEPGLVHSSYLDSTNMVKIFAFWLAAGVIINDHVETVGALIPVRNHDSYIKWDAFLDGLSDDDRALSSSSVISAKSN
jgi:hypothetical protein